MNENLELTILMPCLNEAETLTPCIKKALSALDRLGLGRIVPYVVLGDELVDQCEVAIPPDSVNQASNDLLVRTHNRCASSRPSSATKREHADAYPGQNSEREDTHTAARPRHPNP